MKRYISVVVLLLTSVCVGVCVMEQPFPGWDRLMVISSDIVLVRCTETPEWLQVGKAGIIIEPKDGVIASKVEVLSALKGQTNLGPARIVSRYLPRQGDCYLVFSNFHDGYYQAIEPFRIIPLGTSFATSMRAGKSLGDQVRSVLQYRLDSLNRQMQELEVERKRLEDDSKGGKGVRP